MSPYFVTQPGDERRRAIPNEERAAVCVPFVPWRCARCGSTKPRTYGQRGRIRFHRCSCGLFFRSIELGPEQVKRLEIRLDPTNP